MCVLQVCSLLPSPLPIPPHPPSPPPLPHLQLEESRKESKEGSKERDERLAAARTEIEVSHILTALLNNIM